MGWLDYFILSLMSDGYADHFLEFTQNDVSRKASNEQQWTCFADLRGQNGQTGLSGKKS